MSIPRTSTQADTQSGELRRSRQRRFLSVTAVCLAVALVGLFIGAALLAHQVQAVRDSMTLRREIAVRSRELQSLFDVLQDVEAGQQGLLLGGQGSYRDMHDHAARELPGLLERAVAANSQDPRTGPHVAELRRLAGLRLAETADSVRLYLAGQREQALQQVRAGSGQQHMQQLRVQLDQAMTSLAEQGAATDAKGFGEMATVKRLAWWTALSLATVIALAAMQLRKHVHLRSAFEKQVAEQASMLSTVVDEIPASLAILDHDLRYRMVNKTFERWRMLSRKSVIGKSIPEIMGEDEFQRSRDWFERALRGEQVSFEKAYPDRPIGLISVSYSPMYLHDGSIAGVITMAHDITAHRNERQRLQRLSERDSLTGLLNRAAFETWLAEASAEAGASEVAVLYVDLDHFKPVNDQYGHSAGDAVLREIAERLGGVVRPTDVVARIGGDEFAVGLKGVRNIADAEHVAAKVVAEAKRPVRVENGVVRIGASVGVATDASPEQGGGKALIARADEMLYRAKKSGRNRFHIHLVKA